jgi:hypothetical protein
MNKLGQISSNFYHSRLKITNIDECTVSDAVNDSGSNQYEAGEMNGVAQSLGYGMDDKDSIPGRGNGRMFSLRHSLKTGSETHPTSYPRVSACSYRGGKVSGP